MARLDRIFAESTMTHRRFATHEQVSALAASSPESRQSEIGHGLTSRYVKSPRLMWATSEASIDEKH
jgi:hypothetical protein